MGRNSHAGDEHIRFVAQPDQLAELERDVARGTLSPALYQQSRDDLDRRVLEEMADAKINTAARQLRASYENAVSTMNEMLTLSASDFSKTAQGMRVTAEHRRGVREE